MMRLLSDKRSEILEAAMQRLDHAYEKHGRQQWGRHEFWGVLAEQVDEVWDEIKAHSPQEKLRHEVFQVIAVCIRYLETGDRYREPIIKRPEDVLNEL